MLHFLTDVKLPNIGLVLSSVNQNAAKNQVFSKVDLSNPTSLGETTVFLNSEVQLVYGSNLSQNDFAGSMHPPYRSLLYVPSRKSFKERRNPTSILF